MTYRLRNLSLIEVRSVETQNSKVVGNSIRFLKRVETQNFKTGPNLFGNKLSSLNWPLTSNDTDSEKTCYTKVVDNFDTFPESIYTPSSDKWSRSYHLWKSEGAAEISSFLDRSAKLIHFGVWAFFPVETEEAPTPQCRELSSLSNEGV
jgi:hypothetical protein